MTDNTNGYLDDPTLFDKLLEPVESLVNEQNQKITPHQNEKFFFPDFFRLLIYYCISGIPCIARLMSLLHKGLLSPDLRLPVVPRSTFNDAFGRFSADSFKAIFAGLVSSMSLISIPELDSLGLLYCIDGSLFPTLSSMLWAEYTKNSKAIKLHLCFELNRMIPVEIMVGSGNSSEREALRQMLVSNVTYIADRGYAAFRLFNDILLAQAHFIIRVKDNLIIGQIIESLTVSLPEVVQGFFKDVTDQLIIYKNDPHKNVYRLVCFSVGKELYHILTDRQDLTTFQVIVLYAYRWQIELFFRFLKRTMTGIHIINHTKNGITIQFYTMLISALLQLKLKQEVELLKEDNEDQVTDNKIKSEDQEVVSQSYQFFSMIGDKLKRYWKIGIEWLSTLQVILHLPFDDRAIELLDSG